MIASESSLILFFVFLFGLCVGSFLNAAINRLPRNESISFPSFRFPKCLAPINFYENIPLLGYILLRRRRRSCGTSISFQQPAVELLTGLMFITFFLFRGPNLIFIHDILLGSFLIAVFFIDLRHMIIPNRLNLVGGIAGCMFAITHGTTGILLASSGAAAGMLILGGMALLGRLLFHRESIGAGDFKLVMVIGLFLGPLGNCIALALAVISGGTWGIFHLTFNKSAGKQEVPFGPFIAVGCWLVILFRKYLVWIADLLLSIF